MSASTCAGGNDVRAVRTVHIHLKRKWYEAIRDGVKTTEVRSYNKYWRSRLKNSTHIVFSLGVLLWILCCAYLVWFSFPLLLCFWGGFCLVSIGPCVSSPIKVMMHLPSYSHGKFWTWGLSTRPWLQGSMEFFNLRSMTCLGSANMLWRLISHQARLNSQQRWQDVSVFWAIEQSKWNSHPSAVTVTVKCPCCYQFLWKMCVSLFRSGDNFDIVPQLLFWCFQGSFIFFLFVCFFFSWNQKALHSAAAAFGVSQKKKQKQVVVQFLLRFPKKQGVFAS